jgi:hypothetical protein
MDAAGGAGVNFDIARGAPPFVLGVGTVLKRAAAVPALAKRLRRMKGVLGLRSSEDPQTATIRFDRGRISLSSGVASDAGMVITMNPNDASAKPKVEGAAKHLLFALNVAKVMEPPTRTWQEEAAAFWAFAGATPRMPARLRVVCTDDDCEITLGATDGPMYEVHGSAPALVSVFTGQSILGQDMLDGKVRCVGTIEHVSVLTGRFIDWTFGEGR